MPETLEDIQKIRESFREERMEFSSDSSVIQYSVGVALDLCKSVDRGEITHRFEENDIKRILVWYAAAAADGLVNEKDEKLAQYLLDDLDGR